MQDQYVGSKNTNAFHHLAVILFSSFFVNELQFSHQRKTRSVLFFLYLAGVYLAPLRAGALCGGSCPPAPAPAPPAPAPVIERPPRLIAQSSVWRCTRRSARRERGGAAAPVFLAVFIFFAFFLIFFFVFSPSFVRAADAGPPSLSLLLPPPSELLLSSSSDRSSSPELLSVSDSSNRFFAW